MGGNHHKHTLFEQYYDRVYRIAYFIVRDAYFAQDIAQETFIKAFRNIADCPDGEKAGAWLSTIAARTAIDHRRLQKRRNTFPTDNVIIESMASYDETAASVESEVETTMMVELVLKQIEELDPELREMMVLKYLCEFKDTEIAEAMQMKIGSVKSKIFRVKTKLRSLLEVKNGADGDR